MYKQIIVHGRLNYILDTSICIACDMFEVETKKENENMKFYFLCAREPVALNLKDIVA